MPLDTQQRITRRVMLKMLLSCIAPCGILSIRPAMTQDVERSMRSGGNTVSFEDFVWLSRTLTDQQKLDWEVLRTTYRLILDEPYGNQHMRDVIRRIRGNHETAAVGVTTVIPEVLTEHERWFVSHLLMTWYTGIYFHTRGNRAVTLKNALMYQLQSAYRQPPTYCGGKPGFWAQPPSIEVELQYR